MLFFEIFLIILAALIIGALFHFGFKSTGPWGSFWFFFLVLMLAGLAAEAWIKPIGPVYWNISWGPVLFVIFLFALLMVAATPPRLGRRLKRTENVQETDAPEAAIVTISLFFWAFLLFLFGAVLWGIFA
jgi:hypothetical protein